jgi:hypothetical protein
VKIWCCVTKDETICPPTDFAVGFYRLRLFQAGQELPDRRELRHVKRSKPQRTTLHFSLLLDVRYYFNLRDRPDGYGQLRKSGNF